MGSGKTYKSLKTYFTKSQSCLYQWEVGVGTVETWLCFAPELPAQLTFEGSQERLCTLNNRQPITGKYTKNSHGWAKFNGRDNMLSLNMSKIIGKVENIQNVENNRNVKIIGLSK